ncbi:MAG: Gfo/Idh/MocA family oxidoreductase, partial [Planctomycetaceae bacterium]|nr:Gfo/Idh/MocA family oxidoreductase [Planctomycetaceae bacterium]
MTDPMVPVKVGVIGIGNMGWHHARVLSLLKDADLVGVSDPDAERGALAQDQFDCLWFADYRDMLSEVEAVCIAVPTLLHHAVGLACLEAGLHVLIEKPIAASQEEAASLSESASRVDRLLQVGHIERFNPAFRELTKVVA